MTEKLYILLSIRCLGKIFKIGQGICILEYTNKSLSIIKANNYWNL